jgi:hypothetical protein
VSMPTQACLKTLGCQAVLQEKVGLGRRARQAPTLRGASLLDCGRKASSCRAPSSASSSLSNAPWATPGGCVVCGCGCGV